MKGGTAAISGIDAGPAGGCSGHFRSRGRPGERDVHDTGGLSRGVLRATVIPRGGDRQRMAGEPLHHRDIGPPFPMAFT